MGTEFMAANAKFCGFLWQSRCHFTFMQEALFRFAVISLQLGILGDKKML